MGFHKATSEYPDSFTNQAVKDFFAHYYEVSNNPEAHEEYTKLFTADATFTVASEKATGNENIYQLRKKIWADIPNRDHRAVRIFPFGADGDEFMVYGTVDYKHHDEHEKGTEWAARARLAQEAGTIKMALCHIFLDTAAQRGDK